MKKLTIQLAILLCATTLFAQWVPVNNGLPDYPPTTLIAWVDTVVVSTYGGGIYLTYDNGENWSEMPGTLPNLFVNSIQFGGGQFDAIGVSTDGGPFICVNGGYIDCNGTGLTNNNTNWWSGYGYGGITGDAVVGTNGDGIFVAEYTSPFIYDWAPSNPGLTGNALVINDGLVGAEIAVLATDGGIYKAEGNETEWTPYNNGLSGDALKVNDLAFGYYMISTDGGLYFSFDLNEDWVPVIPDEKFNVSFYMNTDISPTGFMVYAFGENGYYSQNFETWTQMDFGGMEGEVTAAMADSTNLYIGFTIDGKDGKESGGIYRKPLEQFITGIENHSATISTVLHQNFPNPFKGSTKISYSLSNPGFVSLKVYDIVGKEIQTLTNQFQTNGTYTISFDASHLDEGIYFYSLQVGNKTIETKRMIMIR